MKQSTIYLVQTYNHECGCWNCHEGWTVKLFSEKNAAIAFVKKELEKYDDVEETGTGMYISQKYGGHFYVKEVQVSI